VAKGDHIWVRRRGYTHHGIDAGDGTVLHYAGYPGLRNANAKIERTTLGQFAKGGEVQRFEVGGDTDPDTVIQRAESRLGEKAYNLATNNCEHFARWCVEGESRSPQVATVGVCTTLLGVAVLCWWVKRES
jgi:hypothetical protein